MLVESSVNGGWKGTNNLGVQAAPPTLVPTATIKRADVFAPACAFEQIGFFGDGHALRRFGDCRPAIRALNRRA